MLKYNPISKVVLLFHILHMVGYLSLDSPFYDLKTKNTDCSKIVCFCFVELILGGCNMNRMQFSYGYFFVNRPVCRSGIELTTNDSLLLL